MERKKTQLFSKANTSGMLTMCPDYTKYHKPKRTKRKKSERTNYDLTPSQKQFRQILNHLFPPQTLENGKSFTCKFR